MGGYYTEKLHSAKLFQVYDTELARIREYLREEIAFVRRGLQGDERVLELGCGYGRIMKELAPYAGSIVGIDISSDSIHFATHYLEGVPNCRVEIMDAYDLQFGPDFDVVLCLQNGISAIRGKADKLITASLRILVPGGKAYFSTYSANFWPHRLAWFQEQAAKNLLGELDMERTKDGNIVCKDGFTATTFSSDDLKNLAEQTGCRYTLEEVNGSSLFLVLEKETS